MHIAQRNRLHILIKFIFHAILHNFSANSLYQSVSQKTKFDSLKRVELNITKYSLDAYLHRTSSQIYHKVYNPIQMGNNSCQELIQATD